MKTIIERVKIYKIKTIIVFWNLKGGVLFWKSKVNID